MIYSARQPSKTSFQVARVSRNEHRRAQKSAYPEWAPEVLWSENGAHSHRILAGLPSEPGYRMPLVSTKQQASAYSDRLARYCLAGQLGT